ncbi:hypothetical protein [Paraburkholderia fungorum]
MTVELSEKHFTIVAALRHPASGAYGVIALAYIPFSMNRLMPVE